MKCSCGYIFVTRQGLKEKEGLGYCPCCDRENKLTVLKDFDHRKQAEDWLVSHIFEVADK